MANLLVIPFPTDSGLWSQFSADYRDRTDSIYSSSPRHPHWQERRHSTCTVKETHCGIKSNWNIWERKLCHCVSRCMEGRVSMLLQVSMHGERRPTTWSRLRTSAYSGNTSIELETNAVSGWSEGDQIVIAPSGYDPTESEIRTIASINDGMPDAAWSYFCFMQPLIRCADTDRGSAT